MTRVWVDFNEVSEESTTVTSRRFVDGGLAMDQLVTAYDGDGNTALAHVVGLTEAGVTLRVDMTTFAAN